MRMVEIVLTFFQVFTICSHLPRTRAGKMRVEEFINLPIISEETFNAIDRNKDGFLTKGEIKLTNKNASMSEVLEVRTDQGIEMVEYELLCCR